MDDGPKRYATAPSFCVWCGTSVSKGERIHPIGAIPGLEPLAWVPAHVQVPSKIKILKKPEYSCCVVEAWVHYDCALSFGKGDLPPVPVCLHFARSGKCANGDKCFFAHPPAVGDLARELLRARRADPEKKLKNRGEGRRNQVKNRFRASVFRRKVLDLFGVEYLRRGSGVIDVAGGTGEMAWELINLNQVPAMTIEPRPLELSSCRDRWTLGQYWRNTSFHKYLHCSCNHEENPQAPNHLRLLLSSQFVAWAAGDSSVDGEDLVAAGREYACSLCWDRKGLHMHEECDDPHIGKISLLEESSEYSKGCDTQTTSKWPQMPCVDDQEIFETLPGCTPTDIKDDVLQEEMMSCSDGDGIQVTSASEVASLVRSCSIITALHPDQATEYAVTLALALGKPFAVIPCCVYAAEFPKRKLPSGAPVRTYYDLLEYLQSLDSRIRTAYLDFEGKNIMLYMTASDAAIRSAEEHHHGIKSVDLTDRRM